VGGEGGGRGGPCPRRPLVIGREWARGRRARLRRLRCAS